MHKADVREDSDPAQRGNPSRLFAAMLFAGTSPWLAQDGSVFGVEGEAMLFVVGYWGRCGLGDGEEMSL